MNIQIKKIGMTHSHASLPSLNDEKQYIMTEYESLTSEAEQCKYIYALVGKALFWAQCFELQLQISIPMIEKTGKCKILPPAEYDTIQQYLSKKTLGQLIRELKKKVCIDRNAEILLNDALDKRNYIAHHFFKSHSYDFGNAVKMKSMICELTDIEALFRLSDSLIKTISNLFFKAVGLSEKDIDFFAGQAISIFTSYEGKEADKLFEELVHKTFRRKL